MWDDARQLNAAAATLAVMAFAALLYSALAWAVRQPVFAFREVVVTTPLARTNGAYLEAVVRSELAGTFFTLDLAHARAALAQVPWVRTAGLRRQWPHRLEIEIEEHVPLARWNDSGLVNTRGEVFAADWNGDLPQFVGPAGAAAVMTVRYRDWSSELAALGLRVHGLVRSARGGWEIRAEHAGAPLAIELGRDDVDARLSRLIAAYPRTLAALERAGRAVERVDLRYRNGFAARVPGALERPTRKT
ncbi:MAG TPA: cell division protein FtsQ/DivIB [Casimicrobiaceae bacterium]|nr:cell division protein FtsQ/DivIB [Casimicrobiaceae bacterium]